MCLEILLMGSDEIVCYWENIYGVLCVLDPKDEDRATAVQSLKSVPGT